LSEPDDECMSYARSIAVRLRSLGEYQRAIARQDIEAAMVKAQFQTSTHPPAPSPAYQPGPSPIYPPQVNTQCTMNDNGNVYECLS
jgi:hypothetical protein